MHSSSHDWHQQKRRYRAVVFACTVQRFAWIFFRSNNIRNSKFYRGSMSPHSSIFLTPLVNIKVNSTNIRLEVKYCTPKSIGNIWTHIYFRANNLIWMIINNYINNTKHWSAILNAIPPRRFPSNFQAFSVV